MNERRQIQVDSVLEVAEKNPKQIIIDYSLEYLLSSYCLKLKTLSIRLIFFS